MEINFINQIRGIAFILMFIYHIFIFLKAMHYYDYLNNPLLDIIGQLSRNTFIILVGISLYLSYINSKNIAEYKKKQILRAIKIYCIAIIITIITYIYINDYYIVFGVLHFISISIFLLYNFVNNIPILLFIVIFCMYLSNFNYLNFNNSFLDYINSIIGFNYYKNTIDHFSLIKWIPIIILGIFIGHIINYYNFINISKKSKEKIHKKNVKKNNNNNIDIISWIGKNTLLLYIIHIPIIIFSIKYYFELNS
jgi:uncharacterized membrane protein